MYSDKDWKGTLLAACGIVLAGMLFCWLITLGQVEKLETENYKVMAVLMENMKAQYPEFAEEELMQFLNSSNGAKEGEQILRQYGFVSERFLGNAWKKQKTFLIVSCMTVLLLTGICVCMVFVIWQRGRRKSLAQLTEYLQRVSQGDYTLDILENKENELSILKNELYKVTVMLKESAELSGRQKKALSDSVSDISHQLKTPLTSVMVLLDNLSESESMPEETRREFLSEITRQTMHVNWLVAALLKLSRLDAGVVNFETSNIEVDTLLSEVIENLEILAEWKQIVLKREGMKGAVIKGDYYWMREAVTNLVKNAIEHSREQSEILLSAEENAVYAAIRIQDFGEGMDEEEQRHIFERFYRKNPNSDSVGIGLALAKEIVERQNGYLSFVSKKNQGTSFVMKFLKC